MKKRTVLRVFLCAFIILLLYGTPSFAGTQVGGLISANTTWTLANSPYTVTSTVQVYGTSTSPVTLTIQPGVVVYFNSGTSLQIGSSTNLGALVAQGTSTNHITFTQSAANVTWGGINFQAGTVNSTTNLQYVDIQYSTGISMTSASPTIGYSTITNVSGYGMYLTSSNPSLQNVTISSTNSWGMYLISSNPVLNTVAVTANGTYGIYLSSSSPTITNGSLTNSSSAGYGIYGSGSPVISNYNVSIVNTATYYGCYLSSTTSSLSLTNSTITNGLYIGTTGIAPTITGNTFTNVDNSPMHAGANIIAQILSGNTITGMSSAGQIQVVGEVVNQNALWSQLAAPYVVVSGTVAVYNNTTTASTLTINPGVTVQFASGSGLQIGYSTNLGALVAQGTSANHITLTRSGASGNWSGLNFQAGTVNSTTNLQYVDIQYSTGVTMTSASPTIGNSTITNVSGYGMNLTSSNPALQNVTISSTNNYGMYLSSSNPVLNTVTVTANGTYGIYLSSSSPTITNGSLTNSSSTGHGIYGSGSPVISNYNVSIVNTANYYGCYLSSTTSSLSLTNSTIANGLYLGSTGIAPTITGNTFTNANNSPIHAGANFIVQLLSNNTINGMTSAGQIQVVGEVINQNTLWVQQAAPYVVVSGTVSIYNNATTASTLTINPGVTVQFASGSGMQIGSGSNLGALVAQGTSGNHITFTRSGASGNWPGLNFQAGTVNSTTNLQYVDIQYSTGVTMTSASPTIGNSTITNVSGYGMNLSSSNPSLLNVTISSTNSWGLYLTSSNPVLNTVTVTANGTYGIYLSSSSPTITNGSLTNSSSTGYGIYGSGSPVISNYNVSIVNTANYYGCYLSSTTSSLSLTNSTIANGLYLSPTGIAPTITGNTFTNVDSSPMHAGANIITQILSGNTITGMSSAGQIQVVGEVVNQNALWTQLAAPYVVSGTVSIYNNATTASTLTINPGVTVQFASGSGMQIGSSTSLGALVAQGTSANHITFTRSGTSGTWSGLNFQAGTVNSTTNLQYVDIQYSTGLSMTSASPTFGNSTLTNVTGWGMSLYSSNPILNTVTISNSSGSYGIYLSSSSPIITGGSLTNSTTAGNGIYGSGSPVISNYSVSVVNAVGNYGIYLSTSTSALSITNSTIGNGLYLSQTGITPTITGNTFTNYNTSQLLAGAMIVNQILNNNVFSGMTGTATIGVVGEPITQNTEWKNWPIPYAVASGTIAVSNHATLTIDPGVIVQFKSGSITVGSSTSPGDLIAQGTSTQHITFTGFTSNGTTATWSGFTFNTITTATALGYVDISYTGTGIAMNSASPTISNCTLTNVSSMAMNLYFSNPILNNVAIASNAYGIDLYGSSPVITGGSLVSQYSTGGGIFGSGSPVISNWSVSIVNSAGAYGVNLSSGSTSSLSITNSTIGNGLYLGSTGIAPTITGNTFTNANNSPIYANANSIGQIVNNNIITGMTSTGKIEVVGDVINQNSHWTQQAAPYVVVSGAVSVYNNATTASTLTIDPGVTIQFASGCGMQIGNGASLGALVAQGTSANHITLTRSGTSGTWSGINFQAGTINSTTNLQYVDIQYSTGISMTSASPTIGNSTITNVSGYGMNLTSSNPALQNVTISSTNSYGLYLSSSNPVLNTVTITANGTYGIYLGSSSPIITNGSLSNSSSTGHGIYGNGSPVISNYNVSIVNTANYYGLYLTSTTSSLSLTNSTIANGLYIGSTGIIPTITGNTLTNVTNSPIHAGANIIGQIINNNTVNGMTSSGQIQVVGEVVNQNAVWPQQAGPYVVSGTVSVYNNTTTASTLTINPGVTVMFGSGAGMQVGYSSNYMGILNANGNATSGILFTSSQANPTAGYWAGITFNGNAASASSLGYATISYAGAGAAYSNADLTFSSSSPVISNCLINNSAGSGVYLTGASAVPVIVNSEITGNKWGVYSSNSNPNISNTKIHANTTAGVWNATTAPYVDARDNWWGVATGPTYSANPNGTGDAISNNVYYSPWLGQTPGAKLSITAARVSSSSLNPNGGYVYFSATLSTSATWTITITDVNNNLINTFSGTGTVIGQKWYGNNSQSVAVANGIYSYIITAYDPISGTSASTPEGTLMVSSQIPIANMDVPLNNQLFQCNSTINITGTVTDPSSFKNYSLTYGAGENPASWTNLTTSTTPTTSGLLYSWITSSLTDTTSYTLMLTVTDNAGNIATSTALVQFLCIQNAAPVLAYISPNGDGIQDTATISATISQPSTWTVAINNSTGVAVRTYSDITSVITQTWDGKDSGGNVVSDGTYTYQINAIGTNSTTTAVSVAGTIVVDTTPPVAQITAPTANSWIYNTVPIIGSATDANLNTYEVDYGPPAGTGPWNMISSSTASVSNGTLATWVISSPTSTIVVPNGDYMLRLTVTDLAGNTSVTTVPIGADNLILSNVGISSNTIQTNAAGTSTVSFNLNSQATVTINIIPEKQGPAGVPVYQAGNVCNGTCSFTWNGTDNTGKVVPDEAYLYVLNAFDGTRTVSYGTATTAGSGTVTCSQSTNFNPVSNQPMTITYTTTQPSRVNLNIAWSNLSPFTILNAFPVTAGAHTFIWNAINPSNNQLLDIGAQSSCSITEFLNQNFIITTGDTVQISGLETDPYTLDLAYGQFTRILYTISRNANVTVKLTSPSGQVLTLVSGQLQTAGPQEIDWNGLNATDTTGKETLITEEGNYLVTVQAVNPATGTSSIFEGNVGIGY